MPTKSSPKKALKPSPKRPEKRKKASPKKAPLQSQPKTRFKFSELTRKRMSKAHTGKKLSEETKAKIRAAKAERKVLIELGWIKPYKHTEETKAHLSKVMRAKRQKPSKIAHLHSRLERSNRSRDKKLLKKLQRDSV